MPQTASILNSAIGLHGLLTAVSEEPQQRQWFCAAALLFYCQRWAAQVDCHRLPACSLGLHRLCTDIAANVG